MKTNVTSNTLSSRKIKTVSAKLVLLHNVRFTDNTENLEGNVEIVSHIMQISAAIFVNPDLENQN